MYYLGQKLGEGSDVGVAPGDDIVGEYKNVRKTSGASLPLE